jgi:hypothetical protein
MQFIQSMYWIFRRNYRSQTTFGTLHYLLRYRQLPPQTLYKANPVELQTGPACYKSTKRLGVANSL